MPLSISDFQLQQANALYKTSLSANPVAGAELTATVPTGKTWQFVGLRITLVTSAVVANRVPSLVFDDGTNLIARNIAGTTHPASITAEYYFGDYNLFTSGALGASGIAFVSTANGFVLPAGYRIRTITTALDVADDYGIATIFVKEI